MCIQIQKPTTVYWQPTNIHNLGSLFTNYEAINRGKIKMSCFIIVLYIDLNHYNTNDCLIIKQCTFEVILTFFDI